MRYASRLRTVGAAALGTLLPFAVAAQNFTERIRGGVDAAGGPAGFTPDSPGALVIIGTIIAVALSLVGVVLLVLLLYAGFLWMTAGGNEEKVQEARRIIVNAIIGLVITASAYAISDFVLKQIGGSTTGEGPVSSPSP